MANVFPCLSCMARNTIASTFQSIRFFSFYSGTESSTDGVVLVFSANLFFLMVGAMLYLIGSPRICRYQDTCDFFFDNALCDLFIVCLVGEKFGFWYCSIFRYYLTNNVQS